MRKNKAFTLLELLLALSISGFIIIGIMQGFGNAQKILLKARSILQVNKSVCLLFNQIERDFNTAIIPTIAKIEKKEKKIKGNKEEKKPESKNDQNKEKEKEKEKTLFFIAESTEEDEKTKIRDKKYDLFKSVSFVNTNPLQIWGQKRGRLVRVQYELVKNKQQSDRDTTSYDLYRKETPDLTNEKFKEKETFVFTKKKNQTAAISKHVVATSIKGMFIEYVMPKPKKKDELLLMSEKQEEQLLELFSWGTTKETKNIVPEKVEIYIIFWDATRQSEKMFGCSIPIFSYPTQKKKQAKKKKEEKEDEQPPQPRR